MISANQSTKCRFFRAVAMEMRPPNQISASQAALLPIMSFHFSAPVMINMPTPNNATVVVWRPCRPLLIHRLSIKTKTPNTIFSFHAHRPMSVSSSRTFFLASPVSFSSGGASLRRKSGRTRKETRAGTMLPSNQVGQSKTRSFALATSVSEKKSETKGLAAIPVRKVAAAIRLR